jgi:hypothetical protein
MPGHRAIRRSCKTCKHKPAQLRKNPSLHNHHGICSFRRYHKSYCRKTTCGCQRGVTKTWSVSPSRAKTRKRKTSTAKRKYKLVDRKCNYTTALAQYRRGDITYTRLQQCKRRKRIPAR